MTALMVVDTDVLIDYLRGVENAVASVAESVDEIVISTVSVAELYAGVRPHD
jgi:predicted nucleic acid-binding protein